MSRQTTAARELREAVTAAPTGTLEASREELISQLAPERVNGDDELDAARYAQASLTLHGLRSRPELTKARIGDSVVLEADNRLALQAAIVVGSIVTIVGGLAYWAYGLLALAATAIAVWALATRWRWLDAIVPRRLPRGRMFGLGVLLVPLVVAGIAGVLPIRKHRTSSANNAAAVALVKEADAAIDHGDFTTAKNRLFEAEATGNPPASIQDVRAHLIVAQVQSELDDFASKEGIFDEAERAFAAGRRAEAIRLMSSIRGFRNADARLRAYRRGRG